MSDLDRSKMDILIEARGIEKTYRKGKVRIDAVRRADLDIARGECVAVIGPSGAGKSTLLHMIGGLDTPTRGSVFFEGRRVYGMGDGERSRFRNRKVGFVFQFYNLLPEFTVLENTMMPLLMGGSRGMSRMAMRAKAGDLLSRMGLDSRLGHRPGELSGGEAQRVAIARALVMGPDILLCDEPTGNLDSSMGRQIYDIIESISEENRMSVVVVTHRQDKESFFDKVYYMKDGVLSGVCPDTAREGKWEIKYT
ncbi:MAG: ABC transporter ATP-binding protein [Candidatus Omnitrophota bacterium]